MIRKVAKAGNGAHEFVKDSSSENLTEKALSMVNSAISPFLDDF